MIHIHRRVFSEGESAAKMYIVLSGRVGIFKEAIKPSTQSPSPSFKRPPAADGRADETGDETGEIEPAAKEETWADRNVPPHPTPPTAWTGARALAHWHGRPAVCAHICQRLVHAFVHLVHTCPAQILLAEFSPHSKNPWFGEMGLITQQPRSATAFTVESTQLLSIHAKDCKRFFEVCIPPLPSPPLLAPSLQSLLTARRRRLTLLRALLCVPCVVCPASGV